MLVAPFPVRPLHDRVMVVEVERGPKFMIELPDTAKNIKPKHFQVVAVGTGMVTPDGKPLPPSVKVGDVVMISQRASTAEVNVIAGQTVIAVREYDVLAVVSDD